MRFARILASLLLVLAAASSPATLGADIESSLDDGESASALIDVPPEATDDAAAVSIIRREAEDLPPDTFPAPWEVPYHEILPADAVFEVPATVTRNVDLESFGILGWDPAVHGYPAAAMFTHDTAGTWSWLEDGTVHADPTLGVFVVRGGTRHGGPVFGAAGVDLVIVSTDSDLAAVGDSYWVDGAIRALPDSEATILAVTGSTSDSTIAHPQDPAIDDQAALIGFACLRPGSVEFETTFTVRATRMGGLGEVIGLGPTDVDITHTGRFTCAPPCHADLEPNDEPADATAISGGFCVAGTLPSGDQDMVLWDLPDAEGDRPQTITLVGVPGTQTLLQLYVVTSDPGAPVELGPLPVFEVSALPDATEARVVPEVLLRPGRYVAAVARSDLVGGGQPDVLDYGLIIEPATVAPTTSEVEPNDDVENAVAVANDFTTIGDRAGDQADWYAWTVADGDGRWDLTLDGVESETVWLDLLAPDGAMITSATDESTAALHDLALDAGTYLVKVSEAGEGMHPYVLRARPGPAEGDPEPNDTDETAIAITEATPMRGRLAGRGDADHYALTVPDGDVRLRDARLVWRSENEREVCLLDPEGVALACQRGIGGVSLPALRLAPGRHVFVVSGHADPDDVYVLRIDPVGPGATTFEAEPNDRMELASPVDVAAGIRARGGPDDIDYYRLAIEGEPQLWQIDVEGSEIGSAEMVGAGGVTLATADLPGDGTSASFDDLYLVPGDHWLRVSSEGTEYAVSAVSLGPPDPDGEREPNAEPGQAERYRVGSRRIGRLPQPSDRDLYRFTLAGPQHLLFGIEPPADGALSVRLLRADEQVAELRGLPVGQAISYDAWLAPGDYYLELAPEQVSEDWYELTSERLDPFVLAADQEPNDSAAWARPVPRTLSWTGDAVDEEDEDWYVLPQLAVDDETGFRVHGDVTSVQLSAFDTDTGARRQLPIETRDDGTIAPADPPGSSPLYLAVSAAGAYQVSVFGGGLVAEESAAVPALELGWRVPVEAVAAYWPEEQVIDASLEVTNSGSEDVELSLETVTSHYLWDASVDPAPVTVAAGDSLALPVTITAGADAWAQEPVQVAAQVTTAGGGRLSSATEIAATTEATPFGSRAGWRVPDEMLGGLNAARTALGAVPGGTLDAELEGRLFDDVTPDFTSFMGFVDDRTGSGLHIFIDDYIEHLPLDLTVDLAGDTPLPVSGVILNPRAGELKPGEVPLDFELLLSDDGMTWQSALHGRLSPLAIDQAFVLDEPIEASQAKLRITSLHSERPVRLALGEWKVIVEPGMPVGDELLNIAQPDLGGHVVNVAPFDPEHQIALTEPALDGSFSVGGGEGEDRLNALVLGDDPARALVDVRDARDVEVVVGFQDDRAAQVTLLEWQHPRATVPAERLERVSVEASLWSPLGPWRSLGTWELTSTDTGVPESFVLSDPTWIRFLRLRGTAPADAEMVELPSPLRAYERATDADYRSILGEWGDRSGRGPFEWSGAAPPITWSADVDVGDSGSEGMVLEPGVVSAERVGFDVDEDWYLVDVPEGHNRLELAVDGWPTVGVGVELFEDAGLSRPMSSRIADDGSIRYQADVEPGRRYALRVHQPPFSAVFAFDTSGSMEPYRDTVRAGLQSFAADVRRGREAVMLLPFEQAPLLPQWEDDPYLLQAAVNSHPMVEPEGSSNSEIGLIGASALLAEREGARAILLLTDGWTLSFDHTPEMWETLARVRPLIFSVQVVPLVKPGESRDHMQDWAASSGGHFSEPATHGEMDRAFERLATWLRRPAAYSLVYETLDVRPASLSVAAPSRSDAAATALAPGVGVEIILDTSGSMRKRLGGKRRIEIAKASLRALVNETLAEGVPVAIRTFGRPGPGKAARCATSLTLPLTPLDRYWALQTVKRIKAGKKTGTPIAAALAAVPEDLAGVDGLKSVVLITDGAATCDSDVPAAIAALGEAGLDVKFDIVGFALEDEKLKAQMSDWAAAGGGAYYDASGAKGLARSLTTALGAPFRVYGPDTEPLAIGSVGGEAVTLDPGTYRVEVLAEPPVFFDDVELGNGASVTLELPGAE